jgi:hypothetical protein
MTRQIFVCRQGDNSAIVATDSQKNTGKPELIKYNDDIHSRPYSSKENFWPKASVSNWPFFLQSTSWPNNTGSRIQNRLACFWLNTFSTR